jgi:serine/threonine protein phosphatase PrpC
MEKFILQILKENDLELTKTSQSAVTRLVENARISELTRSITEIKKQIIEIFKMYREKEEFKDTHFTIPNATAKKEYEFVMDISNFPNIKIKEIRNIDQVGLQFDSDSNKIYGTPTIAGSFDLDLVFYNVQDESKSEEIKVVPFLTNADPKDLWKDIPSDKNIRYAKNDDEAYGGPFLDKKIVVASKRGRSHAHEGLPRDDHFSIKSLHENWAIVAVADGAGSAKYSRQGSKIATESLAFSLNDEELLKNLSELIKAYVEEKTREIQEIEQPDGENNQVVDSKLRVKNTIIKILYKEIVNIHNRLIDFAKKEEIQLKDLHTTLIFALCKKFDFGYALLTFGVGDCPIALIKKDASDVSLLNVLDIGDFGGGTRFITMPEIFIPEISNRFAVNIVPDFSRLFLMTDGIYDPKFETENKLEDPEAWDRFLADLDGDNEDKLSVDLQNKEGVESQLLDWMNYWSKGNHDDRTLAIIY